MSYSFTLSESTTFTVTHARHLAAKVATDLKRMQRFYGLPDDRRIMDFELEATELLRAGYLGTVTYGFRRNDRWVEPTLRYSARDLVEAGGRDDDPGKVRPRANTDGADFHSYLTYSSAWNRLTPDEQANFKKHLPFQRHGAPEPGVSGYWISDRRYSAGGRALDRVSVRNYG